ncbi:MAG: ZIP family metal transporter [Planctomycetes bacterium]|nr:ZIP family metal transporter [Planctomycetota bacterium]
MLAVAAAPEVSVALWACAVAGLSTIVGALPALFVKRLSPFATSLLLALGAGVMLAATAFSLIAPALELHAQLGLPGPPLVSVWAGVLSGAALVHAGDRAIPHEHFVKGREGHEARAVKRAWLFVAAIALHNLPEGLAVGAGFGGESADPGLVITAGIVLQNLPEGLVAAVSLLAVGYGRGTAVGVAALTGVIETLAGLAALGAATLVQALVPFVLALAGGAMLYVVVQEVIPEAYRRGVERPATWGLVLGFLAMLTLDQALG